MASLTQVSGPDNQQIVEPFLSLFEQHIQARIEQGQMRPVDVPLAIRYLFAVNLGLLGLFILGDPLLRSEWESEEMIGELVSLLFDGIGARRPSD